MTGELIGVYVFGSVARGERDQWSDLDLLAVVSDRRGKVPEADVLACVPNEMQDLTPSISWYGRKRLGQMYKNGELFAWHLWAETFPLFEHEPILGALGRPAPYRGAMEDVSSFTDILRAIPKHISAAPENAAYELGLIYVCLRNIAMSASWVLCGRADFSRYSPFNLWGDDPLPIDRREYELAMACRMAGQRGHDIPRQVTPDRVDDIYIRLLPWVDRLKDRLSEAS